MDSPFSFADTYQALLNSVPCFLSQPVSDVVDRHHLAMIAAGIGMMGSRQRANAGADDFVNQSQIDSFLVLALIAQTVFIFLVDHRAQWFQELDARKPFDIVERQLSHWSAAIFPERHLH